MVCFFHFDCNVTVDFNSVEFSELTGIIILGTRLYKLLSLIFRGFGTPPPQCRQLCWPSQLILILEYESFYGKDSMFVSMILSKKSLFVISSLSFLGILGSYVLLAL